MLWLSGFVLTRAPQARETVGLCGFPRGPGSCSSPKRGLLSVTGMLEDVTFFVYPRNAN